MRCDAPPAQVYMDVTAMVDRELQVQGRCTACIVCPVLLVLPPNQLPVVFACLAPSCPWAHALPCTALSAALQEQGEAAVAPASVDAFHWSSIVVGARLRHASGRHAPYSPAAAAASAAQPTSQMI